MKRSQTSFWNARPRSAQNAEPTELRKIVSELVVLLNSKKILEDSEGMSLLRTLAK